jgi:hypothetical protein
LPTPSARCGSARDVNQQWHLWKRLTFKVKIVTSRVLRAFDFPPAMANLLIQDSALLAKAIHFPTRGLFLGRDRHR